MAIETFNTHGNHWFMGVCGLCGEKSALVELRRDSVAEQERSRIIKSLTDQGWLVEGHQAWCPGCRKVIERRRTA